MIDWSLIQGFDWDDGNKDKSVLKHEVSNREAEQAFANKPILVWPDMAHSNEEERFQLLGQTDGGRRLFVAFTLRGAGSLVRVISARDMSPRERHAYEQESA